MALLAAPLLALLLAGPYIWIENHRCGFASIRKAIILYIFLFYMVCAYCLVILPLPDPEAVAALTDSETQLVPFRFLWDIATKTPFRFLQPSTWLSGLTDATVLVPVYNILLLLPFGAFLRYYLGTDKKKTVLFSFLLSLFFELTQLTGLYFLYARGYRIFDVDDLMLNTLGGLAGWYCARPLINLLPSRRALDAFARQKAARRPSAGLSLRHEGRRLAGL